MTPTETRVRALVEPIAAEAGLTVFDLEHRGGVLRVFLDRDGGVDLDAIADATRRISRALDEHDPIAGRYTLEVSSPGLERALRTPEHWAWAVGRAVSIKLGPGVEGDRRLAGDLVAVTDDAAVVRTAPTESDPEGAEVTVPLDAVEKARTTFAWGGTPKPGSPSRRAKGDRAPRPTAPTAGG